MALIPLQPAGRLTRKARAYEADIARLRAQGHTLASIREALAAAGIEVSISTVWREALRSRHVNASSAPPAQAARSADTSAPREISFFDLPVGPPEPASPPSAPSAPSAPPAPPSPSLEPRPVPLSGRAVADAFRRSQSTLPLIQIMDAQEVPSPSPNHRTKESP